MEPVRSEDQDSVWSSVTNIPVEIWYTVFALATHIPGVYDVDDYAAIVALTRDSCGIGIASQFKASMQTNWPAVLSANTGTPSFSHSSSNIFASEPEDKRSSSRKPWSGCHRQEMLARGRQNGQFVSNSPLKAFILNPGHPSITRRFSASFDIAKISCVSPVFCTYNSWIYDLEAFITYLAQNLKFKRLEVGISDRNLSVIEATIGGSLEVLWLGPATPICQQSKHLLSKLRALITTGRELYWKDLKLPSLVLAPWDSPYCPPLLLSTATP